VQLGYSANDVIGESMEILMPESHRERHWIGFNKAMATPKVLHNPLVVNSAFKCGDGKVSLFPARQLLLLDAFGVAVGVLVVLSPACKSGEDNGLTSLYLDTLT
jgi:hypothetical protein